MTPERLAEIRAAVAEHVKRYEVFDPLNCDRERLYGDMLRDLLAHVDALEAENLALHGGGDDVDAAIAYGMAAIRRLES